jgi:hypothetical protein
MSSVETSWDGSLLVSKSCCPVMIMTSTDYSLDTKAAPPLSVYLKRASCDGTRTSWTTLPKLSKR